MRPEVVQYNICLYQSSMRRYVLIRRATKVELHLLDMMRQEQTAKNLRELRKKLSTAVLFKDINLSSFITKDMPF